jgi:protoporphyrinogen oxidase
VYEHFWAPLLDAKFGSRTEDVSAAWLLGRIKFRGERDLLRGEILGYFDGGFHRLIEALIDAVGREHVLTGARVTDLGTVDGRVDSLTVERATASVPDGGATVDGDGDGGESRSQREQATPDGTAGATVRETHDVDAAVVATMPTVLESLTGYECDIDFQGSVVSVFSLEEPLTDTYWLNIAEEAPFGALIEHTNFVPPERYGGEHLLYAASYVQDPADPLWQADDAEVERRYTEGLVDLFPSFDPDSVRWVETARNPRSAPVYERGYLDMVVPYDLDAVADGLYYAGMASRAQYPERSLDGGVVAGFECADRIAER